MLLLVAALVTVGCDQLTKHAASTILSDGAERTYLADTVRVAYAENPGGFLSLGADLSPTMRSLVFTGFTALLLVGAAAYGLARRPPTVSAFGLVLFLAGGASNWIDRVQSGYVVDFLNVGVGSLRTGVFNVADVAIMFGAALFAFALRDAPSPAADDPP